jgi:CheY-like chemotaxis protein
LLADDSVTIRKVVELTFADEGVDVTTVADSNTAMAKFLEDQPNIVLVDVGLPGTTGYDLCEMIKGDESTSHIPVLLLVGSFEPFDQDAAERSGADGFLTKPFHSIRDLVNRVHELLGTQTQPVADNVVDFDTTIAVDDNEDIDELYERSFAETVSIDNYETVPGFDAEDTFSDEIIPEEDQALSEDGKTSTEQDDIRAAEEKPAELETAESAPPEETIDASHHSVDEWLDDEMIETVSSAEPGEIEAAEETAIEAAGQYEESPAAAVDIEPIKEFDWSPAAIVTAADENEIGAAAGFSPGFVSDESHFSAVRTRNEHDTEELPDLNTDKIAEIMEERTNGDLASPPAEEPSAELVDFIARRVIERLSDRAIREIAQEAVPRIAEKMMREALEEDRNS